MQYHDLQQQAVVGRLLAVHGRPDVETVLSIEALPATVRRATGAPAAGHLGPSLA